MVGAEEAVCLWNQRKDMEMFSYRRVGELLNSPIQNEGGARGIKMGSPPQVSWRHGTSVGESRLEASGSLLTANETQTMGSFIDSVKT